MHPEGMMLVGSIRRVQDMGELLNYTIFRNLSMFRSVPGWGRGPQCSQVHFALWGARGLCGRKSFTPSTPLGLTPCNSALKLIPLYSSSGWLLAVISGTPQCQAALSIYPSEPYQCPLSVTRIRWPLWRFGGCFQLTHSFSKDNNPNESIRAGSCWASPAKQAEIGVFALRICSIGPFPLLRLVAPAPRPCSLH